MIGIFKRRVYPLVSLEHSIFAMKFYGYLVLLSTLLFVAHSVDIQALNGDDSFLSNFDDDDSNMDLFLLTDIDDDCTPERIKPSTG